MDEVGIPLIALYLIFIGIFQIWRKYRKSDSPVIVAAKTAPAGCLGTMAGIFLLPLCIGLIPTEEFPRSIFQGFLIFSYFAILIGAVAAGALTIKFLIKKLTSESAARARLFRYSILLYILFALAFMVREFRQSSSVEEDPSYSGVPIAQLTEKIEIGSATTNSFFGESDRFIKVTWPDGQTSNYGPLLSNGGGNPTISIYYIPPASGNSRKGVMFVDFQERLILDLDSKALLQWVHSSFPGSDATDEASEQDWDTEGRKVFVGLYESGHFSKPRSSKNQPCPEIIPLSAAIRIDFQAG